MATEELIFLAVFPFLFLGFWLAITTILARLSGWPDLQARYPDMPETRRLERLHFQSGSMGDRPFGGVQYGGCLTFDVCSSGLRVKVWRIFGPFLKPIFVPWSEISATAVSKFLATLVQLQFGNPEKGRLTISRRAARRIHHASNGAFVLPTD